MRIALMLIFFMASTAISASQKQIYSFKKPLMHTIWDFSLVASSAEEAQAAFDKACGRIDELDKKLAMWRPDSELYAFNAKAGQGPQEVSQDLDEVIALGQDVSEKSSGAADSTVGPLVQLWYENLKEGRLPEKAEIAEALKHVNYRFLKRVGVRSWSAPEGVKVDLGSVAKGYALDAAAKVLGDQKIGSFLMNAGGQVYAKGHKPDGEKWTVGVINPRDTQKMVAILKLEDQSMSTSGDYEQSTIVNGKRYHHIMDPKTGWPVVNGCVSVTVILPLGGAKAPGAASWCDALDTPSLVLGREKGKKLLQDNHASGILINEDKKGRLSAVLTDDLIGKVALLLE